MTPVGEVNDPFEKVYSCDGQTLEEIREVVAAALKGNRLVKCDTNYHEEQNRVGFGIQSELEKGFQIISG